MKRYTKEFIKDQVNTALNWYYPSPELTAAISRINKWQEYCEKGLITDTETIIEVLRALGKIE